LVVIRWRPAFCTPAEAANAARGVCREAKRPEGALAIEGPKAKPSAAQHYVSAPPFTCSIWPVT